ncbi:MAG: hypothetical protein ACKO85_04530, partial [Isosphaeraceae bacterium]
DGLLSPFSYTYTAELIANLSQISGRPDSYRAEQMESPMQSPAGPDKKQLRRHKWYHRLKPIKEFIEHPLTKLTVGIILVITSAVEIGSELLDDIPGITLGSHHGLLVLGIINALSSLPDLVEGMEHAVEGTETLEEQLDGEPDISDE